MQRKLNLFSTIKKAANNDYLFSVISKILGVLIMIVYSIVINRYLGASLKGVHSVICNYYQIIVSFLCVGMYQVYPFYKKRGDDIFYRFINNMTSLYLIVFILFIVSTYTLLRPLPLDIKVALCISPVFCYIKHMNYVVTIESPRRRNISSIIIDIISLLFAFILILFTNADYNYVLVIIVFQMMLELITGIINLRVDYKKIKFTIGSVFEFAKFGFIPMLTLFLMTVNYRVDVLMLQRDSTISMAQIGIYSVGVMLAEKVWLIPDAIKDILLSKLCKGKGADEVAKIIRYNVFVMIALVIVVCLLSNPVINFLYGEEYNGAGTITTIMLVGVFGMIFYKMVYSYNVSNGDRAINLILLAIAAFLNVVGNYLLIPLWGIYGAAATSVISYSVCGFSFLLYFKKHTGIKLSKIIFLQKEDYIAIKKFIKY